jgi:hypothetical protein
VAEHATDLKELAVKIFYECPESSKEVAKYIRAWNGFTRYKNESGFT